MVVVAWTDVQVYAGEVERGRGEMLQRCPGEMLLGQSRPNN